MTSPLFTLVDLLPTYNEAFIAMARNYEEMIEDERQAHSNEIVRRTMEPEIITTVMTNTGRALMVIKGGM